MQSKESVRNIQNDFKEKYDVIFSLTDIEIKPKNLKTPQFSKGLKKCSNTERKVNIKYL